MRQARGISPNRALPARSGSRIRHRDAGTEWPATPGDNMFTGTISVKSGARATPETPSRCLVHVGRVPCRPVGAAVRRTLDKQTSRRDGLGARG
jgi:hypothetical protein